MVMIWCDSKTDSIVWMREEHAIFTIRAQYPGSVIRGFLYDGDYFRNKIASLYKKLVEFSFKQDVQKADP